MNLKKMYLTLTLLSIFGSCVASSFYVDKQGVLRDSKSKKESAFFGFNYCIPFAHGYRMLKKDNVDIKESIRRDFYHMNRLGVNAFRIHIWDVEISKKNGDLLTNEHLDYLDFCIAEASKYGIHTMITAIAFWGNGYPEKDDKSLPGFSNKYGKSDALFDPDAILAQENYLQQLMNHINPYTGNAYKNDPYIVGVEINNEPSEGKGTSKQLANYIDRMVKSIRKTGCDKPIFYNTAQNSHNIDVHSNSKIQGLTYQWYPSGLVKNSSHVENFLPLVSSYNIPWRNKPNVQNKAKIIYEFDAADVNSSYVYPAIARSFRHAGFQWATMFSYDSYDLSRTNTEYPTHYLNLVYTPNKAVSFFIAAHAFKNLERGCDYGMYPQNNIFADYKVDYHNDLSMLNSETVFAYSNSTDIQPVKASSLRQIVGCGSSPVVKYDGTGCYFLEKVADGEWMLEIYPDVIKTGDPHSKPSSRRFIAHQVSKSKSLKIILENLSGDYRATSMDGGQSEILAVNGTLDITPGKWMLISNKTKSDQSSYTNTYFPKLDSDVEGIFVNHTPASILYCGQNKVLSAEILTDKDIVEVGIEGRNTNGVYLSQKMTYSGHNTYKYSLPSDIMKEGFLYYSIYVQTKDGVCTFPSKLDEHPKSWRYYSNVAYTVPIVDGKNGNIPIWEPAANRSDLKVLLWSNMSDASTIWDCGIKAKPGVKHSKMRLDMTNGISDYIDNCGDIFIEYSSENIKEIVITLVDSNSYHYQKTIPTQAFKGAIKCKVSDFTQIPNTPNFEVFPQFSFASLPTIDNKIKSFSDVVSMYISTNVDDINNESQIKIKRIDYKL